MTTDTTPTSDSQERDALDPAAQRILNRLDERLMIEKALRMVEDAILLKRQAEERFASFSIAKRRMIAEQAAKLDAALLELAAAFEEARETAIDEEAA